MVWKYTCVSSVFDPSLFPPFSDSLIAWKAVTGINSSGCWNGDVLPVTCAVEVVCMHVYVNICSYMRHMENVCIDI